MAVLTLDLIKHCGPTPPDDMAPQINTDCGNFSLELKHLGLCASPFSPDSENAVFALIRKEDFGPLSYRPVLFSLAQIRHFWHCLLLRSDLTSGVQHLKPMSMIRLWVVGLDALTPASVHSLWSSPTLLNGLFLTVLSRLQSYLLLVLLFLLYFSLPLDFLLMCFDTALWEHPTSFAITFWGFPSWWRMSVMVFCTTVRSAVFPVIVKSTGPDHKRPFKGSGNLCRRFGLISWLECDTLSLQ